MMARNTEGIRHIRVGEPCSVDGSLSKVFQKIFSYYVITANGVRGCLESALIKQRPKLSLNLNLSEYIVV